MKAYTLVLALVAVTLSACGGGSNGNNAGPALPTVQAVVLSGNQRNSLEPLADLAQWTYQCDSGAQPQITMTHFGLLNGADTFEVHWPVLVVVGRASSSNGSYVLTNDANGNLSYYGFVKAGQFTQVPSILIESTAPTSGASYTIPDQGGGTVTSVFQTTASVSTPTGTYGTAYEFHNTYSESSDISFNFYDVRGVGTVRFDYSNGTQSDRCLLASTNVSDSTQ